MSLQLNILSRADALPPTYSRESDSYPHWARGLESDTAHFDFGTHVVSRQLLESILRDARSEEKVEAAVPTVASFNEEDASESAKQIVNANRDATLERLSDIEHFLKAGAKIVHRNEALQSCRNAMAFVSFWPSDLQSPDADVDDDGVVSVEQYRPDGALQAVFDFLEGGRTTYAILKGTRVVDNGYLSLNDPSRIAKVFRVIRAIEHE